MGDVVEMDDGPQVFRDLQEAINALLEYSESIGCEMRLAMTTGSDEDGWHTEYVDLDTSAFIQVEVWHQVV